MGPEPEVVTCGEAMLLMLAEPGVPLERAIHFRRSVAGAESNVATALARLGHRARWWGRLGADPAGDAVLRELRADGVDVSWVQRDPAAPTGLLLRDSHPARGIEVQYYRSGSAASLMEPAHIPVQALAGARLLHLTGITPMLSAGAAATTWRLMELARSAGAAVSFDPNVRHKLGGAARWAQIVGPLLAQADLVLAGEEELRLLTGHPAREAAKELLRGSAQVVVVKRADRTAEAISADGCWVQPPFPVPVVDPVGAGDAFAAGFLSAWLRGLPTERALAEAATLGALAVQCAADTEALPTAAGRDLALTAFLGAHDAVLR